MDLTTTKMADTDSETPPRSQPIKPLSLTNGIVHKKHHHSAPPPLTAEVVVYRECLKNHAASLGSHALDGCGEFMPSPNCTPTDPTSLKCAACDCHRNFHRRDYNDQPPLNPTALATHFLEFNHYPPPPPLRRRSSSFSPSPSPSPPQQPPPISISYAPHMLLALSTADERTQQIATPGTPTAVKMENQRGRKRFRTKFSQDQKEKMSTFAEKLGWKMQRSDEETVAEFCKEVGIRRGVLKVWMHNNKNTFGKRENYTFGLLPTTAAATAAIGTTNNDTTRISFENINNNSNGHLQVSNNGSSSSS